MDDPGCVDPALALQGEAMMAMMMQVQCVSPCLRLTQAAQFRFERESASAVVFLLS